MILSQNFGMFCDFLNYPNISLLNQQNFSLSFTYDNFNEYNNQFMYYVLDNTPFPNNSTINNKSVNLGVSYSTYIQPTNNYVRLIIICNIFLLKNWFLVGIVLGVLVLGSITCILFSVYKFRRLEEAYKTNKERSSRRRSRNSRISFDAMAKESMMQNSGQFGFSGDLSNSYIKKAD